MTDILKRLDASFRKLFASEPVLLPEPEPEWEEDAAVARHLRQLPAEAVNALCDRLADEVDPMSFGTLQELRAFRETRTRHDAGRLAFALRHVCGREYLALEVEALLSE
jgi:hypothetical protein